MTYLYFHAAIVTSLVYENIRSIFRIKVDNNIKSYLNV